MTVDRVVEAVLAVGMDDLLEEVGHGLARGLLVRREFDCGTDAGCAHGSDRCRPGSGGYHGVGARRLLWFVRLDGYGGVAFDLHTPIYAESVRKRLTFDWHPLGSVDLHVDPALGEHSWMTRVHGTCDVVGHDDGCWCDGTMLQADTGTAAFLDGGSNAVWAWLAEAWLPELIERSRDVGKAEV